MKKCTEPGFTLNLNCILTNYYNYTASNFEGHDVLKSLVNDFLESSKRTEYARAILLVCKNHDTTWVLTYLQRSVKPLLESLKAEILEELKGVVRNILRHIRVNDSEKSIINQINEWIQ